MSETPGYLTLVYRRQEKAAGCWPFRRSEYRASYVRVEYDSNKVFRRFSKAFKTKAAAEETVLAWRDNRILGQHANPARIRFVDLGWID